MLCLTIILTATVHVTSNSAYQVDKQDRINTYLKATRQWLHNTHVNVILVENSGYDFPELKEELEKYSSRFEIFSFIPNIPPHLEFLKHSKGGCELVAINHAFNHSVRAKHSLFIIKVTGRFYIPGFDRFLLSYNSLHNVSSLSQNNTYRCEFVGAHILHFHTIFDMNQLKSEDKDFDPHIENVYHYRFSQRNDVLHAPLFNIEPTQRGGLNEIYSQL